MNVRVTASLLVLACAACSGAPGGISLSIDPRSASVPPSGSASFTATVSGAAAQSLGVTWSVQEGTSGGTVDSTGKYTAPAAPGTFHVVATSLDDSTKAGVATVTVSASTAAVAVSISPRTTSTALNGSATFTATVTGSNAGVTWSVQEGTAGGSVDSTGKYSAPAAGGTYHVVATSVADPSKRDLATVVVVAPAAAMTLISRSVPATSSAGTASWGQDASYGGIEWGFHIADVGSTGTLVYDLSGVPPAQRQKILVALYMARGDPYYQLNYRAAPSYTPDDTPDAYVLEGASQAAGPWTALVTVASNNNQYKTHTIADFSAYTFLRFRSIRAPPSGCRVKMDVYDASAGVTDGIVFYGDSITTNIFQGGFAGFPPQWFSKQIQASHPAFFPFVIGGGWPATTSGDGVDLLITNSGTNFTAGLSAPLKSIYSNARYAALVWGANDAPDQTLVDGFRSHYRQIVDALRAQGQVVILASPTWAPDPVRQAGLTQIRASIGFHLPGWIAKTYAAGDYVWNGTHAYRCTTAGTSVSGPTGTGTGIADGGAARWSYVPSLREDYAADSGVIPGPDLYSVFLNHPEWLVDGLHPNDAGEVQWRTAWVNWAGSTLYGP